MAGKTGSEDGVQAEPVNRAEDESRPVSQETRPDDVLDPGEPSWPEDAAALRTEILPESAVTDDRTSPATDQAPLAATGDLDAEALDPEVRPVTPGRAGPPWDWETPPEQTSAEATHDQPGTVLEAEPITPDVTTRTASPSISDAAAFPADPPLAGTAARGSAPVQPPPPPRRGLGGLLLGGMIAAALGFGAAWLARDQIGAASLSVPADLEERLAALEARPAPDGSDAQALEARLDEAEARLQALEDAPAPAPVGATDAPIDLEPLRQEIAEGLEQAQSRAAVLEERLAALEAQPAARATTADTGTPAAGPAVRTVTPHQGAPTASEPRLAQIETGLAAVEQSLSGLQAALASLEGRVGQGDEALATLDQRVAENAAALQALDQRLGEAEASGSAAVEEARTAAANLAEAQARAAQAETQARTGSALASLEAALNSGGPFEAPLSDLQATGRAVPEILAQAAVEGVPTLASLRGAFPEAARAGLAAARDAGLIDEGGVMGFLRGQLSVRSTAPREGEDPDAVLSRAESALAEGSLATALSEIATLPEPVRAAMTDWIAQAQARADAQAALATLREAEPDAAPAN